MRWIKERIQLSVAGVAVLAVAGLSGVAILQAQTPVASASSVSAKAFKALGELTSTLLLPDGRQLTLRSGSLALSSPKSWFGKQVIALPETRVGGTGVVLPDGRVLIWGGSDMAGHLLAEGVWFDPSTTQFSPTSGIGLAPGIGQSLTVLSDGEVLVGGGEDAAQGDSGTVSIWNPRTHSNVTVAERSGAPYAQKTALLGDGSVKLWGGIDRNGAPVESMQRFDPQSLSLKPLSVAVQDAAQLEVAASDPAANSADVSSDAVVGIRFSEPVDPASISSATVSLIGPAGPVDATIVGVQDGRLAFVTPKEDLLTGSHYTVALAGVRNARGIHLPFTSFGFVTASLTADGKATAGGTSSGTSGTSGAASASGQGAVTVYRTTGDGDGAKGKSSSAGCRPNGATYQLCRVKSYLEDGAWYPGQDNAGTRESGHWRLNIPDGDAAEVARGVLAKRAAQRAGKSTAGPGSTSVSGQIRLIDSRPIAHVQVSIGTASAYTDASGNFVLGGVAAGRQSLFVDGTTANDASHEYGQFAVDVDVPDSGQMQLGYRMYLPRILARDKIKLASPTQQDMVITHPDIPGLEIHIPAGTVIRDHKGKVVTEFSIVPMPVDRAPIPAVANFPVFFSLQPGGASVQSIDPTKSQGLSVVYPNYMGAPAGSSADFFVYQPGDGWRVYGKGYVTADGRQIQPNAGVSFTSVMSGSFGLSSQHPGDPNPAKPNGPCCGDPVDLWSGTLVESQTDVHIDDVIPIDLQRVWHNNAFLAMDAKMFGSWRSNYDIYVYSPNGDFTQPNVRLPDGTLLAFSQVATRAGDTYTWLSKDTASKWYGAVLETVSFNPRCGDVSIECFLLTLRDGTQYQFTNSYPTNGAPSQLTYIRDRFGNQLAFSWSAGLLQQITSPSGRYVSFTYNSDNNIQTVTDHTGRVWTYTYHRIAVPVTGATSYAYFLDRVTYPDTTSTGYTYNESFTQLANGSISPSSGTLTSAIDRNNATVVTNQYDPASGQVKKQTFADGSYFQFNYTSSNGQRETDVTDPLGHVTQQLFDAVSGYPLSETAGYGTSLAQTTTYVRDPSGLVLSFTDALNRKTTFAYNDSGEPVSVTRLAGTSSALTQYFTWTADFNQIASRTDELGHTTTFGYTNGCLTSITDPLGQVSTVQCNGQGQPVKLTDPLSHSLSFSYQGNDLRGITDALGRTATRSVDALGRTTAVTDALGNTTQRSYDTNGRIQQSIDARGKVTSMVYDNEGHIKTVSLPSTAVITYQYTPRYWVTQRSDAMNQSESWTYDAVGDVSTYTDRKGQVTHYSARDALGRFTGVSFADGTTITADTYDAGNRLRQMTDSSYGTTLRSFDDLDRLTGESSPQGAVTYSYYDNGLRKSMTPASQAIVNYVYDNDDQLKGITQGTETVAFDYDAAGRRSTLTLPNGVVATYGYDDANELTGISYRNSANSPVGDLAYGYDAVGKRIAQTGAFASDILPQSTTHAGQFDLNNRQTAFNGQPQSFDANGNLTSDGTNTYVWNARNQLAQIKQGDTVVASFSYDAVGRRVAKTMGGSTTNFLYDGPNAVQETLGGVVNPILTGLGIDERYARNDVSGRTYFLTDALGSTVGLTDATAAVIQRYQYDPYGNVTATGSATNPYQYTGRENDLTGLYYYRARYYRPGTGQFVSEDPMSFAGGQLGFYAYAGGDPLDYNDPTGKFLPLLAILPIIGGVINGAADVINAGPCANKWAAFGKGFVAGAVGTLAGIGTAVATDNPWLAGSAAGAVSSGLDQWMNGEPDIQGALINTLGGGLFGGLASKAFPLVGFSPSLTLPRTAQNLGPNSMRMLTQEASADAATGGTATNANKAFNKQEESCGCK